MEMIKRGLNSNQLKMIAITAMTIDHLAWVFFPGYRTDPLPLSMHIIGRLTAPIMMYLITIGFYHTRNVKKYIGRLFLFAIPSHFAYCFMFGKSFIPFQDSFFDQTSVMWAFAFGLLALAIRKCPKLKEWQRTLFIFISIWLAFPADWSSPAAGSILYMGVNKDHFKKQMLWMMAWIGLYAIVYAIFINPVYGALQLMVALSIPLLKAYNGERGKARGMKWIFYIYYPLHMFLLGGVRLLLQSQ
jgi:hypothetical protein